MSIYHPHLKIAGVKVSKANIIGAIFFLCAVTLILYGSSQKRKVYDKDCEEFGIQAYTLVSEKALVVDATFSGTIRKGDKLFSTYDRSEPVGKRSCPT